MLGGALFSAARALFYESSHLPYRVGGPGGMCYGNKHANTSVLPTVFPSLCAQRGAQVPWGALNHVVLTWDPG